MTVFRRAQHSNFTVLPNELINDESISWEARAVLIYLLSKPPDWQVLTKDLMRAGGSSRDRTYRIINELIQSGYLKRIWHKEGGKFDEVEYLVYDSKTQENSGVSPFPEKPETVFPHTYKELTSQRTDPPSPRARGRTALPEGWAPSDTLSATVSQQWPSLDITGELNAFTDYYEANGERRANWDAAFRNWCRLAATRFAHTKNLRHGDKVAAVSDANRERSRRALDRLAQSDGQDTSPD